MKIEFGNIVISLLIAVVSARVTLHYALKRFYFEKWWERKAEAYNRIFEALHHLKNHVDHELAFIDIEPPVRLEGEKVLKELIEKMKSATGEIRKQADIGAFVISEEAVRALHTLQTELDEAVTKEIKITRDLPKHYNLRLSAVNKCLESMRHIAEKDLKGPMTARECVIRFIEVFKK